MTTIKKSFRTKSQNPEIKWEYRQVPSEFSLEHVRARGNISYPNFNIKSNAITFISGKSGCGKSTVLGLLNGTLGDYQGTINYKGNDLHSYELLKLRQEVLLVGQAIYLFEGTVEKNFTLFYDYRGLPQPDANTMKYYLQLCSILIPLETQCHKLSGGEKQRVHLAIFISFEAQVFLLDEPTAALNTQNAHTILENVCQFCDQKNITLVVVSHDNSLAEKFAANRICLGTDHD